MLAEEFGFEFRGHAALARFGDGRAEAQNVLPHNNS